MTNDSSHSPPPFAPWTRREWFVTQAAALVAARNGIRWTPGNLHDVSPQHVFKPSVRDVTALGDTTAWETIVQKAVDAARAAGASYADARISRQVQQLYRFSGPPGNYFGGDLEINGLGVRALVNGYWGFAAASKLNAETAARLAQDAVAQAKVNALGTPRTTNMGSVPPVRGHWSTPLQIDPFSIPIEEKNDYIRSWIDFGQRVGAAINLIQSGLHFARQERVVATSDGSLVAQTLYETGGSIVCTLFGNSGPVNATVEGLQTAGTGWELIRDAKILDQLAAIGEKLKEKTALAERAKPAVVGRYTIVCDGSTMASLLDQTVGLATQLDRALGYEANASGTSYLDNPLGMLGTFKVGSPLVNVTANRSAPTQLATVKWDDEGVAPQSSALVKDGILNDFQTTREQAAWLASYYDRQHRPITSHGYAASENALKVPMQLSPNLALEPSSAATTVDDLIANVENGIFVAEGEVISDFQARNGLLIGSLRKITNGRLGPVLTGGGVIFNSIDLWGKVAVIGGASTRGSVVSSQYPAGSMFTFYGYSKNIKGQPQQITSHSVTAPAATITGQAIIDPSRKA